MAYNLQSLITILEQLLNPEEKRWIVTYNKPQLQSLLKKASSLQKILENISGPRIERLGVRIRDAVEKAEDIIEGCMVNELLLRHVVFSFPTIGLRQVIKEFGFVREQVLKIKNEGKSTNESTRSSSTSAAAFLHADPPSSKNVAVVGVDEDLLLLKDRLTGYERKLEIIPITGMGGIGKTTLARTLYEDPLIVSHFGVRAWTTISQDYNVRAILLGLLSRPNEKPSNELTECTNDKLKDSLHKRLFGRRYLIVLDDMWSTDSWDVIRRFLPDNYNGSRIVLTTRQSDVAKNVGTGSLQHEVQMLKESDSWNLLEKIVSGEEEEYCPDSALEAIGRKIVGDCGGLPLAVNVIGGILSKAERSMVVWEHIANDVSSALSETDEGHFSNVLSLSYNHLPNHLKPCFFYMGAFPEDYEIKGSRLVYMWMAEGLVKSCEDRSLEEVAEDYLKALVERNLVMVTRKKTNGKALSYGMHDLLRDVCMRKASEEKFLHVMNEGALTSPNYKVRRVSVQTSCGTEGVDEDEMSLARCFICFSEIEMSSLVFLALRLLRVLDVFKIEFQEFPVEILQLVNLRYLAFSCKSGGIPREIPRLLNLHTLIGEINGGDVPNEIWEMSELRYLKLSCVIYIPRGYMKQNMQEKLHTIFWVRYDPDLLRMGFFKTIPNVMKLGIFCDEVSSEEEEVDLRHLHKLQTLKCASHWISDGYHFLPTIRFPPNLRKLILIKCAIFPGVLTTLCSLPNLQVLSFSKCEFENGVFEATEDDVFGSLQYLYLLKLKNLVHWRADDTNFPTLKRLYIVDCPLVEEIPSGIGNISTLELIQLYDCNPSLEASAKEIEKEQQDDYDNYHLQVTILHS